MDEGATPLDLAPSQDSPLYLSLWNPRYARVSFTKEECKGFLQSLSQYLADLTGVELKSTELLLQA
jgi:hypothetical protein